MSDISLFQYTKKVPVISWIVIIIAAVLTKDWIHSSWNDYSFYLSESLLFGSFWILFLPFVAINRKWLHRINPLLLTLSSSLIHITFFAFLVNVISLTFFRSSFNFERILLDTLGENGIACLLVYAIGNYALPKSRTEKDTPAISKTRDKISVKSGNKTIICDLKEIIYVKSEKPYISLVTKNNKYLLSSSLKQFSCDYGNFGFIQVHRSTIVNGYHVNALTSRKNGDYDLELSGGESVRASRSFRKNFIVYLQKPDPA